MKSTGSPDGNAGFRRGSKRPRGVAGVWPASEGDFFSKELLTVMVAFFCFEIFFSSSSFHCVFCLRLVATC